MNAHDLDMFTRGAIATDVLMLATWWLVGAIDRRKADRAAAKARAQLDAAEGYAVVRTPGGDQEEHR